MSNSKSCELSKNVESSEVGDTLAQDFMGKNILTVKEGTTIGEAINLMIDKKVSGLPVVDGFKQILGMVTEYDLLLQAGSKPLTEKINYSDKPITVEPETPLKEILILFYKNRIRRLPVLGVDGRVVGIISRIDLLNRIAKN